MKARNELQRYNHYFDRWDVHIASRKLEENLRIRLLSKVKLVIAASASFSDSKWIELGMCVLFECRRVLAFSFVIGYYLFADSKDVSCKLLFEQHQNELLQSTEALSALLDTPVQSINTLVLNKIMSTAGLCESRIKGMYDICKNTSIGSKIASYVAQIETATLESENFRHLTSYGANDELVEELNKAPEVSTKIKTFAKNDYPAPVPLVPMEEPNELDIDTRSLLVAAHVPNEETDVEIQEAIERSLYHH